MSIDERRVICLSRAREAEEKAARSNAEHERQTWAQVAESWRRIADQILHLPRSVME